MIRFYKVILAIDEDKKCLLLFEDHLHDDNKFRNSILFEQTQMQFPNEQKKTGREN